MPSKEPRINNAAYDFNAIPENIPNDDLDDIDDRSMREQRKARFSQDTRFRRHLACWVMFIVPIWLALVMAVLFLRGFRLIELPTEVLITLLATTTINVLGLAYIVLKGIFPEGK